jgi:hypothetical protein
MPESEYHMLCFTLSNAASTIHARVDPKSGEWALDIVDTYPRNVHYTATVSVVEMVSLISLALCEGEKFPGKKGMETIHSALFARLKKQNVH